MIKVKRYIELLQWHKGVEYFDYDLTVDWAIEMIRQGLETENVLIIASFSKPVDKYEIKPYVSAVLKDLKLNEKIGEFSIISNAYYYIHQILDNYYVRKNLGILCRIHLHHDLPTYTQPFYLLYHAWNDLESNGSNYYYQGANLENIDSILKKEANLFVEKFIKKPDYLED